MGTVAALITAAASGLWASLQGPLLTSVLVSGRTTWGPLQIERGDLALRIPMLIIAIATVRSLATWIHAGLMATVSQRMISRFRTDVYAKLLSMPSSWFERHHSGDLLSRMTSDVAQLETASAQALSSIVKDSLQIVALLAVCLMKDWVLFLVVFVVLPGTAIPVTRFARSAKKAARNTQAQMGSLMRLASEHLANLAIVQAFQTEPAALQKLDRETSRYLQSMRRSLRIRGAFSPTTEFLGVLGVAAAVGFGTTAAQVDPSFAPKLVSFLTAALFMYQPVKALSQTVSNLSHSAGAAERLFEILDFELPEANSRTAEPLKHAIEFDRVSFAYPDGRQALHQVSFSIPHGSFIALIGRSGAGKSTLVSLLLGFARPTEGEIRWDGVAIDRLNTASLRSHMAWLAQEPVLLSGSIADNLRMGRADATVHDMERALKQAGLESFIASLPQGCDTPVGERGQQLSGGQRQRLALARAFLRNASLLVLDEPTSAIDASTEAIVQEGLAALRASRTMLVIAHRLSTVRSADAIVVMDAGRIVEYGSHEQLIAQQGLYASLVAAANGDIMSS